MHCRECERLWREFTNAAKHYEKLCQERESVVRSNRIKKKFVALDEQAEAALQAVDRAWLDIERHDSWSHSLQEKESQPA